MAVIEKSGVGIVQIDEQHNTLFWLMNKIVSSLTVQFSRSFVAEEMRQLLKYSDAHFSSEERLMKVYSYPNTKAHTETHKTIISHLVQIIEILEKTEEDVVEKIGAFIGHYRLHLQETDDSVGAHLRMAGVR